MVISDQKSVILSYTDIPVSCLKCGNSTELHSLVDKDKEALVSMAAYQELLEENQLLVRTQKLFEEFPESKHPSILCKLYIHDEKTRFEPDEAVDQALGRDPILKRFLSRSSFILPKRLAFVNRLIAQYQHELTQNKLHCGLCSGLLTLDRAFYERLI